MKVKVKEDKNWTCIVLLEMFDFILAFLRQNCNDRQHAFTQKAQTVFYSEKRGPLPEAKSV